MELIEKSDRLQFYYYFKDNSHSINSILRNECEKEILHIYKEIFDTLGLQLVLESLPTEEGGFKETWKFIGKKFCANHFDNKCGCNHYFEISSRKQRTHATSN